MIVAIDGIWFEEDESGVALTPYCPDELTMEQMDLIFESVYNRVAELPSDICLEFGIDGYKEPKLYEAVRDYVHEAVTEVEMY